MFILKRLPIYNKVLLLLLLIITLNYFFFNYRLIFRQNAYIAGDWLINYQGGFIRRGFFGEIIFFVTSNFNIPILNFIDPIPYLYEPKDSAYGVGEDVRYFVQKRGNDDSYAIEIDSKQWEMIGAFKGIDDGLYAFIGVTWKLVGAYDIVAQQNELALFKAQKVIPSILYSVKSFTEFARFKRF
jgi:hypothetical protein